MAEPVVYEWYSAEQAVSFFGARRDARSRGGGEWLIFPKVVFGFHRRQDAEPAAVSQALCRR
jgi:hypothetical protein